MGSVDGDLGSAGCAPVVVGFVWAGLVMMMSMVDTLGFCGAYIYSTGKLLNELHGLTTSYRFVGLLGNIYLLKSSITEFKCQRHCRP